MGFYEQNIKKCTLLCSILFIFENCEILKLQNETIILKYLIYVVIIGYYQIVTVDLEIFYLNNMA